MTGFVSLVGAGPGDPELLTLKALRRLREADLVLNDALVSSELLELAPKARRFFVGKRANRPSIAQETINALLIRAAGRGQRVVRLKCGDPFVLGRGGEEALALQAAGVPYEIVPGLSSAIAGPALSGIPVTHRGLASGFAVLSGHAESAWRPILAGIAPDALTLVVLMGLGSRAAIAGFLRERGWRGETPVAIALGASTPQASTWTGTLDEVAAGAAPVDPNSSTGIDGGGEGPDPRPGILIIGKVVSLAAVLSQTSEHPGFSATEATREGTQRQS